MTDLELNKAIMAIAKDWKGATITNKDNPSAIGYTEPLFIQGARMGSSTFFVDYCNNWNDLMPLLVEHMFRIDISRNMVTAEDSIYGETAEQAFYQWGEQDECSLKDKDKITKHALAECLLKVLTA